MEYEQVEMTDYGFAKWLHDQDADWNYETVETNPPVTHFFANGRNVAYCIYNNQKCTRKIFIKKK